MTDRIFYGKPLIFREKAHRYFWNGEPVPSVTTILGRLAKPALIQWAADKAVDHIVSGFDCDWDRTPSMSHGDFDRLCTAARGAHAAERDAAGSIGTHVHDYAERIQRGERWDMAEVARDIPAQYQAKVLDALVGLKQWLEAQRLEKSELERMVMSRELHYAGRTDRWGIINGEWAVLDFKTSSGVYDEHWIQLAGYEWALREELELVAPPVWHYLIHLDKNTGKCTPHVRGPQETKAAVAIWERLVAVDKFLRLMPKMERKPARAAA